MNEMNEKISTALKNSLIAQKSWQTSDLSKRIIYLEGMLNYFEENKTEIALEITQQMGRPIRYAKSEINGMMARAHHMISIAEKTLADINIPNQTNEIHLKRYIQKRPVGTVLIIAPWNYPYLTAINAIVPALLSGNSVLLKHASLTPLCGQRFASAFEHAGLPENVFQNLQLSHFETEQLVSDHRVGAIAFTGSVEAGKKIQRAAMDRFVRINLELGGKDPAYVRSDVNIDAVAESLVEGAFFNSGQSCCGIERIYVHHSIYHAFVEAFIKYTKQLRLGDPMDPKTTLGPMASTSGIQLIQSQIEEAVRLGAKTCIQPSDFPEYPNSLQKDNRYLSPQILIDTHHQMRLMMEENFGPVVGIMPVQSDEEAIHHMNDSKYGLTASIWTKDTAYAEYLAHQVETGTCFVNRCDYLDPALAWTGIKDTGIGCTLSVLGFDAFTRPKSIHIKRSL